MHFPPVTAAKAISFHFSVILPDHIKLNPSLLHKQQLQYGCLPFSFPRYPGIHGSVDFYLLSELSYGRISRLWW